MIAEQSQLDSDTPLNKAKLSTTNYHCHYIMWSTFMAPMVVMNIHNS